ncbi:hypothetical protein [Hymenobacter lapidiphilus]|uniref:Uncharacterized protein n=1 Tax=Hymenobacter lapidiphilus TaxID=2608003 RepID=A0A7Y7PSL5_9BACT|nr:hypothetical protein [Hymenobacter lapidiphilus]NVO33064.1 hypothetical protein [Hymenobacter lapidiphilus]
MEELFLVSYTAHYCLPAASTTNFTLTTNAPYFEVEDDVNRELVLHNAVGVGMARFSNPKQLQLTIVNYDKFLTSLSKSFQNGKQRCDLILSSDSNEYFILGELKDRIPNGKVRKGAKDQLIASLGIILKVVEIAHLASSKTTKRCCYFNKQSKAPTIISAVSAFNRLASLYVAGFQMSCPDIEALGFDFYEYTGHQTVQLS